MANVQAIVKGRILKTKVDGGFIKDGDTTKVVLYGKAEGDQAFVTLKEFIDGLSNGFSDASESEDQKVKLDDAEQNDIKKKIAEPFGEGKDGTSILDKIRVKLSLAYLYKSTTKNAGEKTTGTLKYALHVVVDMESLISKNFPVDVDSISLKIWSDNAPEKIKTEMKISEMQKLIDSASGSETVTTATTSSTATSV